MITTPCTPCTNAAESQLQANHELTLMLAHGMTVEKRVSVTTNVHADFVTRMFLNKSTPYAQRFE